MQKKEIPSTPANGSKPAQGLQIDSKHIKRHKAMSKEVDFLKVLESNKEASSEKELFTLKPINQFITEAQQKPRPKLLFGSFIVEGELTVMFAPTNVGKSVLGIQISNSIASGVPIHSYFPVETEAQKVLYVDCELKDTGLAKRYGDYDKENERYNGQFMFSDNLLRLEYNSQNLKVGKASHLQILEYLKGAIDATGAKVVVIDNISYLGIEMEKANHAQELMKNLIDLVNNWQVTMLVIAHTPKRDDTRPITMGDLAGSASIGNFCNAAFSVAKSRKEENFRYLKQQKVRSEEHIYGAGNVPVFCLRKEGDFLGFQLVEFGEESEHLKPLSQIEKDDMDREVFDLRNQKDKEGKHKYSWGKISELTGKSRTQVRFMYNRHEKRIKDTLESTPPPTESNVINPPQKQDNY